MRTRIRPVSVTLLALGVLIIAIIHLQRFILTLLEWNFLIGLIEISPYYLLSSSIFWSIVYFWLSFSIWRGVKNAPIWTIVFMVLFNLYKWVDRLWISSFNVTNWMFLLVFDLFFLLCLFLIFTRKSVRVFYGEDHEQGPKNSKAA